MDYAPCFRRFATLTLLLNPPWSPGDEKAAAATLIVAFFFLILPPFPALLLTAAVAACGSGIERH